MEKAFMALKLGMDQSTHRLWHAHARFAQNDTLCLRVYLEYIGESNDFQMEIKEIN